jgi:hypothetical protein
MNLTNILCYPNCIQLFKLYNAVMLMRIKIIHGIIPDCWLKDLIFTFGPYHNRQFFLLVILVFLALVDFLLISNCWQEVPHQSHNW